MSSWLAYSCRKHAFICSLQWLASGNILAGLHLQGQGTWLDTAHIPLHKPTRVTNGAILAFGPAAGSDQQFLVIGEHIKERSGSKRRSDTAMDPRGSVGAKHLLVKHK